MTEDEFFNKTNDILGKLDNQGEVSTILKELNDGYKDVLSQNQELTNKNTQLETDRENLRKANMELFLKVGNKTNNTTNEPQTSNNEKLSYDDLFDEEGKIK